MKTVDLLGLDKSINHVISIVGAGGKSSIMEKMAKEFKEMGKRVLVTTTTKVLASQLAYCDRGFLGDIPPDYKPKEASISSFGHDLVGEKICGSDSPALGQIYERGIFDIILIEADGAKKKPIKANGEGEPVIPSFTSLTLGLIGLDSLGSPLREDKVHRADILAGLLGAEKGKILDEEDLVKLVLDPRGLFKDSVGDRILILNKPTTRERIDRGRKIQALLARQGFDQVYIS